MSFMLVNEGKCIEWFMKEYGVSHIVAKQIITDFGLWESIEIERRKKEL